MAISVGSLRVTDIPKLNLGQQFCQVIEEESQTHLPMVLDLPDVDPRIRSTLSKDWTAYLSSNPL